MHGTAIPYYKRRKRVSVHLSICPSVIEICVKQCAKSTEPRDLKFCTHLYTYLLQVKFEGQVRVKRDKA